MPEYIVHLRKPHDRQREFLESPAKRKIIRAGRRGGKTVGISIGAVQRFLDGRRVLYGAPTTEQVERFWFECCRALAEPIAAGTLDKNETEHTIERPGTENRIRAKTCWNANTLRGDYADWLILDEYQLMAEDTWEDVGAPMLMDNNGDAVFIYTPPSLFASGVSKAKDPRHASKMFKSAQADTTGRWAAFHFTSHDNPYISTEALDDIINDMSPDSYRREILAEDDDIEQSWLVYNAFKSTQIVQPFLLPTTWLDYSGHDFGKANPAALFVSQDPATGQFYIYKDYLPGGGYSANEHTKEFKSITTGRKIIRSVGGNQTTEDDARSLYTEHGWPIYAPKIAKPNAQIDRVIGLMRLNKIYIFSTCKHLLNEIFNCLWELDKEGHTTDKIKDEAQYHLLACLRYLFSDFTPETAVKQAAGQVKRYW